MCGVTSNKYGNTPVNIVWQVVRGDTASLYIDFLESDEITGWDCEGWTYAATAYDKYGEVLDQLVVDSEGHSVIITAPSHVTLNWGTKYGVVVADLIFDLEVRMPDETVWTPIVGSITVIGDVTYGGGL